MGWTSETNYAPSQWLSRLLSSCLSLDWLTLLSEVYRILRRWLNLHPHPGMCEILDYDSTLDLVDPGGETAVFKKRQQVKFLQNNIIAFQDYAWGEGKIFADYRCTPGVVVDRYQEGDRWNILISLRETKSTGDITDFYIERTVKHGFTKNEEWWQVEFRHPTKQFKLAIIFPQQRHCQKAVLLQRSRHRAASLGPAHFVDLPDGRQMLTWEAHQISRLEIYTIKWNW